MAQRYPIQGAPELANRLRRALDQQQISGGELELTFTPEVLVKDASVPPFVQDPVYVTAGVVGPAVAAEFPIAGLRFNGPGLLVVDSIAGFCGSAAMRMHMEFGRTIAALTPGLSTIVHDRADLRGIGVDSVALSSVQAIQTTNVALLGTRIAIGMSPAATVHTFDDLNIVMAPGDDLFLEGGTVNLQLEATFLARWFPNAVQS